MDFFQNAKKGTRLEQASIFSTLFFSFIGYVLALGKRQTLQIEDIEETASQEKSDKVWKEFSVLWEKHLVECAQNGRSPTVIWPFLRMVRFRFIISNLCLLLWLATQLYFPYVYKTLTEYYSFQNDMDDWKAYMWATVLVALFFISALAINQSIYHTYRCGVQIKTAASVTLFEKSLKLNSKSRNSSTTGEIVNLMSNDTTKLFEMIVYLQYIYLCPLAILIVLLQIWLEIGLAGFIGVALLLTIMPIQAYLGKIVGKLKKNFLRYSDERVKFTSEVLQGIRVIKLYAWEEYVVKKISKLRINELSKLHKMNMIKSSNQVIAFCWPVFVIFCISVIFISLGNDLSPKIIFISLAFMNTLRFPILLLPQGVNALIEGRVAASRITKFLLLDEFNSFKSTQATDESLVLSDKNACVNIADGSFSWNSDSKHCVLKNINLSIKKGSLVGIIGKVGSGKSSLLAAILGELHQSYGKLDSPSAIGYLSQSSWIQNKSVRENILCGKEFSASRYQTVVCASALIPDLLAMPFGDNTEIGENGVNLSGGQKARISLARMGYRSEDYDLVLLDDPFAALDAHVGNLIFEQFILSGFLKDKTRIIALNSHMHLLKDFDRIIVLGVSSDSEEGAESTILADGSYDQIYREFFELFHADANTEGVNSGQQKFASPSSNESVLNSEDTIVLDEIQGKLHQLSNDEAANLIQKEDRYEGKVKKSSYLSYFKAASSFSWRYVGVIVVFISFAFGQVLRTLSDIWAVSWSARTIYPEKGNSFWIGTFSCFLIFTIILSLFRSLYFIHLTTTASQTLHENLLKNLVTAPVPTFFDVTPVGRILNRFSGDMEQIDVLIPQVGLILFTNFFIIVGSLLLAGIGSPWVFVLLLPVSIVFYRIQAYFRNSSRELKRLNAISKSPIVSLFSESLNGLFTIRAFGIQDELITKYKKFLDEHTKVFLSMSMLDRWLAVRLDMLALLIIAGVAFLGVGLRESLSPEILSLSLTYALILMGVVQFSVRMSIDVENCMTAVERLLHYSNLSKEDHSVDFAKFSNNGSIHFDNVFVKYRKELDYALKGVTFEIQPGQKIGICGRTGCGKSTTILALFRIVEVDESIGGKIYIDGVDISSVRLSELRESLCIIPQDPVLLSGTFRENLDPFNERTDEEIWETLRKIQMFSTVESFPDGLNFLVSENGGNFSHGQRQLICIGRALLRKSKIIVMDEATGSVDQNTDRLIQTMMREYFADCTVLTIAHRLETILDSDKILVLDAGQVKEFDSPETLLANPDSSFSKLYRLTDSVGDNY